LNRTWTFCVLNFFYSKSEISKTIRPIKQLLLRNEGSNFYHIYLEKRDGTGTYYFFTMLYLKNNIQHNKKLGEKKLFLIQLFIFEIVEREEKLFY